MDDKNKYINIKIIIPTCLLYLLHIFTIKTESLAAILAIIEFLIVIYFYVCKPKFFYFSLLLILSGSFDVGVFVKGDKFTAYNLTSLPIISSYLWQIILLTVYIARRYNKTFIINLSKYPNFSKFVKLSDFIIITGIIIGISTIIFNDNNILNLNWIRYFFYDFIAYSTAPMLGTLLIYDICIYGRNYIISLQKILITILISIPICTYIGALMGFFGTYEESEILLSPLTLFFCSMIIFFIFYKRYGIKTIATCIFTLCLALQFFYANALGGKSWLSLLYICSVILIILYKQGSKKTVKLILLAVVLATSALIGFIQHSINNSDSPATAKLQQAVLLLSFADELWYSNIPASPKTRIEEFLNVALEYKEKPYYALLGKGFAGSTKDNITFTEYKGEGAFSDDQFDNHSFIFLHETLNNVFLKFGVVGLIYLFSFISLLIKNLKYNPWGAFGAIWLFLFYGYSSVLCIFGITCVILSIYCIPDKKKEAWVK